MSMKHDAATEALRDAYGDDPGCVHGNYPDGCCPFGCESEQTASHRRQLDRMRAETPLEESK